MAKKHLARIIKIIGLLFFITIPFFVYSYIFSSGAYFEGVFSYLNAIGFSNEMLMFIFIILSSSIGFPLFIPLSIIAYSMDFVSAVVLSIIGITMGSIFSFYIIRFLGRDYLEDKLINKIQRLKEYDIKLQKNGFWTVFLLRIIFLIPFELVNLMSGLSRIKILDYALATFLGLIPGIIITLYFIISLNNLGSNEFFLAFGLLMLLSILPLFSRKIRKALF